MQVLGSYFLAVPLREELSILLGEAVHAVAGVIGAQGDAVLSCRAFCGFCHAGVQLLPRLFIASLLVTLLVAPLTAAGVSRGRK